MNRPRIFISAVSEELSSARQTVSATVRTLGFDPVSQDDFPTGHGELKQWLREQIDSSEGLIKEAEIEHQQLLVQKVAAKISQAEEKGGLNYEPIISNLKTRLSKTKNELQVERKILQQESDRADRS